eukprot:gene3064-3832_t
MEFYRYWDSKNRYPIGIDHILVDTLKNGEKFPPWVTNIELTGRIQIFKGIFPETLTHLKLHETSKPIPIGSIPSSVINLNLGLYNHKLVHGLIPNSVLELHLVVYDLSLDPGVIPDSVTDLNLGYNWDKPLRLGIIPPSVKYLTMREFSEESIKPGAIPKSVTHLNFEDKNIPNIVQGSIGNHIKYLEMLVRKSSLKKGMIPLSVTHLYLHIQDEIEMESIPPSVTHLYLNQTSKKASPIIAKDVIPQSVTSLYFGKYYHEINEDLIPNHIINLGFESEFKRYKSRIDKCSQLFQNVQNLNIMDEVDSIDTYSYLKSNDKQLSNLNFNWKEKYKFTYKSDLTSLQNTTKDLTIPFGTTHLIINSEFNLPKQLKMESIPSTTYYLDIDGDDCNWWFDHNGNSTLPKSIKEIMIRKNISESMMKGKESSFSLSRDIPPSVHTIYYREQEKVFTGYGTVYFLLTNIPSTVNRVVLFKQINIYRMGSSDGFNHFLYCDKLLRGGFFSLPIFDNHNTNYYRNNFENNLYEYLKMKPFYVGRK